MKRNLRNDVSINKNEEYVVAVDGMTHEGQGVARVSGMAVFIDGAIIGEKVRIKIIKIANSYAIGKLLDIVEASEQRIEPFCQVFKRCGGCSLQHMTYEKQLEFKQGTVKDSLERLGGFVVSDEMKKDVTNTSDQKEQNECSNCSNSQMNSNSDNKLYENDVKADGKGKEVEEPNVRYFDNNVTDKNRIAPKIQLNKIIGMDQPYHYRNKAQFPIGQKEGEPQIGFFAVRSHDIIDSPICGIQDEINEKIIGIIKEYMKRFSVTAYEEKSGNGSLRHVVTKKGFKTGEVMIVLVAAVKKLPETQWLIEKLVDIIPGFASLQINYNKERTNVILGKKNILIYGKPTISDFIGDLSFKISPHSFFQVNPIQTEVLYGKALEYAGLTGNETVFDIYCGIGTISLMLAQKAAKVIGVEVVEQAIEDAKENAKVNGVENAVFYAGEAERVIPELYEKGERADVVVVDPPRKGCDEKVLQTIVDMGVERVVYVSCNPGTLARDVKWLAERGYEVREVTPVDMFPWTWHVEAIILMTRSGSGEKK